MLVYVFIFIVILSLLISFFIMIILIIFMNVLIFNVIVVRLILLKLIILFMLEIWVIWGLFRKKEISKLVDSKDILNLSLFLYIRFFSIESLIKCATSRYLLIVEGFIAISNLNILLFHSFTSLSSSIADRFAVEIIKHWKLVLLIVIKIDYWESWIIFFLIHHQSTWSWISRIMRRCINISFLSWSWVLWEPLPFWWHLTMLHLSNKINKSISCFNN